MKTNKYLIMILFCFIFINQYTFSQTYNEQGYSKSLGEWNIQVLDWDYQFSHNKPNQAKGFLFRVENKTKHNNVQAISIEFTLYEKNKKGEINKYYKKHMKCTFSGYLHSGEIAYTDVWIMNVPLSAKVVKAATWTAKVTEVYLKQ